MKNQTDYKDWEQFIQFLKNSEIIELDLSNKTYAISYSKINMTNIWYHIKQESPSYYPTLEEAKQTFKRKCIQQNYVDPFFHFFPIIYFKTNCLFNASIDAMDASLPEEDKHRPDNLQIIPKCLNYAKNILSNEQFIHEWTKRGFKTDFTNCSVKLPDKYLDQSYFQKFFNKLSCLKNEI